TSCERQVYRPCSLSAVFSLIRPKRGTLRMPLIAKSLPKRLQPESGAAVRWGVPLVPLGSRQTKAFQYNRTSTKPESATPKRAGRSVRPGNALDTKRRLHRNRPRLKRAWGHRIASVDGTCQF